MSAGCGQQCRPIAGACVSGQYAYALLDCAPDEGREAQLHHHAAQNALMHRSLFTGQPEEDLPFASPYLLELPIGAIERPIHHWLRQLGRQRAGSTCLFSDASFEELFHHLNAQLDIALPDGSLALMRYYDPRAWLRYRDVLTMQQQRQLFGPIKSWQITVGGQTWTLARSELEQQAPTMLTLSAEQYAMLCLPDAATFCSPLSAETRSEFSDETAHLNDAALMQAVYASYRHAVTSLHITHLPTVVRWVKADVAWAPGLRNHAVTAVWFKRTLHANATAADLLALLASRFLAD